MGAAGRGFGFLIALRLVTAVKPSANFTQQLFIFPRAVT